VNRKFGIAVANGTAALDIAVEALGIGKDDEVILPTFTIISCIHQIIRSGATPVLVDSDPVTWNMDVTQIEEKITEKTKAIMVVHIYGFPVDMDPVLALAKKYNIKIIEDAAEMIGQTYKGKACGSFGNISTFSFYPNKHITTGEGGMVLTDDEELAEKCRSLRNLCFKKEQRFIHEELGWNYRMTNLQAALGLAQLEQLDKFVEKKRAMGRMYSRLLKEVDGIQLPLEKTDYAENIYWIFGIVLQGNIPFDAKEVMMKLGEKGIGTRPFFYPMHLQPVLLKMGLFRGESYRMAEVISQRGFYIPSGLTLSNQLLSKISKVLRQILLSKS
jgi:perosamine synthetase